MRQRLLFRASWEGARLAAHPASCLIYLSISVPFCLVLSNLSSAVALGYNQTKPDKTGRKARGKRERTLDGISWPLPVGHSPTTTSERGARPARTGSSFPMSDTRASRLFDRAESTTTATGKLFKFCWRVEALSGKCQQRAVGRAAPSTQMRAGAQAPIRQEADALLSRLCFASSKHSSHRLHPDDVKPPRNACGTPTPHPCTAPAPARRYAPTDR